MLLYSLEQKNFFCSSTANDLQVSCTDRDVDWAQTCLPPIARCCLDAPLGAITSFLQEMNLRDLVRKFGKGKVGGLSMNAVGLYTYQMLNALKHMKACQILHADIKPDNVLVSSDLSKVRANVTGRYDS